MNIGCIVLAAGKSLRFGDRNKLLETLGDRRLMEWTLQAIPADLFSDVAVVVSNPSVKETAAPFGFSIAEYAGGSISDSIRRGLSEMPETTEGFLFVNADRPFLTEGTLRRMAECFEAHPDCAVRLFYRGVPSNPVLFPAGLRSALWELSGDEGGNRLIREGLCKCLPVEAQFEFETFDADTPEALDHLRDYRKNALLYPCCPIKNGGNRIVHDF